MSVAIYLAGLVLIASVAWLVSRPFFVGASGLPADEERDRTHWERVRDDALDGIRDADFDHELGKLTDEDHVNMRRRLERQAARALHELEGESS